jgi:cytidylate kinase
MAKNNPFPILITFDGEARSGKGTIVQATKDYIRDTLGHKVMLIDAGQVFRVLVVAATRAGVDLTDAVAVDAFLADDTNIHASVQLVKDVYHMQKSERDALLYTNAVGIGSAQVGARPLSQDFKDLLLRGWLKDAHNDGFEVVLLDGRALGEVGHSLEREGLCDFRLGLYFICNAVVGARRTLGFAGIAYEALEPVQKSAVDELIIQIDVRNEADEKRPVQQLVRPHDTPISHLPHIEQASDSTPPIYLLDTSADMTKDEMSRPVMELVSSYLDTAE